MLRGFGDNRGLLLRAGVMKKASHSLVLPGTPALGAMGCFSGIGAALFRFVCHRF